MDTEHNLHLLMCPNRLHLPILKRICNKVLTTARVVMIEKDRDKYPTYMYELDSLLKYDAVRCFVANAPWVNKGKDEKVTS